MEIWHENEKNRRNRTLDIYTTMRERVETLEVNVKIRRKKVSLQTSDYSITHSDFPLKISLNGVFRLNGSQYEIPACA